MSGKAVPCKWCKTDRHLKWKTYNEDIWWIACEGCGHGSDPKPTMAEAGEEWNNLVQYFFSQNWKAASDDIVKQRRK